MSHCQRIQDAKISVTSEKFMKLAHPLSLDAAHLLTVKTFSLWKMTQLLMSYIISVWVNHVQIQGRQDTSGSHLFLLSGRASCRLFCLLLSDVQTSTVRFVQLQRRRDAPLSLYVSERRWPAVSESTASLRRSLSKCHQLQETRPEAWKQTHSCEMTYLCVEEDKNGRTYEQSVICLPNCCSIMFHEIIILIQV